MQRSINLYEVLILPIINDRMKIDVYHRYFDLMDESIIVSKEINEIAIEKINIGDLQYYCNFVTIHILDDKIYAKYLLLLETMVRS